jgi:catechol 2,3-dioxygenase-like lactoylglutathione lyase family enzyme
VKTVARFALTLLLFLAAYPISGQQAPKRPQIMGIAYARLEVTDFCSSYLFYVRVLHETLRCTEGGATATALPLNATQFIALTTEQSSARSNLLKDVGFVTNDMDALRRYLAFHSIPFRSTDGQTDHSLSITDPDGHHITFAPWSSDLWKKTSAGPASLRIIHAGFIVRKQAAMEHFYKDILGFRPYWHGGMKDDQTDWLDLQVPDGTDWVEFMLNVPADADQHTLGVMNHIALGVPDIHAAYKQLLTNGMKLTEEPKTGRDGKWQLNLYDPDQTRVEMMEFTPVEKPCCSEYTGPHPKP